MRITVQTSITSTEFGSNLIGSDEAELSPTPGKGKVSYSELRTIVGLAKDWRNAGYLALPVNGKIWFFNPEHIVRMAIVLSSEEEEAYDNYLKGLKE